LSRHHQKGGYNRITQEFIKGINNYSHCEEYSAKLISPVTEGKDCDREWRLSEAAPYQKELGAYPGCVYFLMNSGIVSSGKTAVLYVKSLKNAVFMG
jgi:hypothetical protein